MSELDFGAELRQARERTGEDLVSVARKLRIRPDILERIEASDLDNMPPRGYARNMVNSYARYLGLNPTEVTRNYLDAQYRAQVESARKNIRPTGFDMSGARRHHGLREEVHADERSRVRAEASQRLSRVGGSSYAAADEGYGSSRSQYGNSRQSGFGQQRSNRGGSMFDDDLFDDIDRAALPPDHMSSAQRAIASRPASASRSTRIGAVHAGSVNGYGQGLYNHMRNQEASADAQRTRRLDTEDAYGNAQGSSRGNRYSAGATRRLDLSDERDTYMPRASRRHAIPEEHSISVYAAPKSLPAAQNGIRDKMPFILAGVILLLLVIIVAFVVNGISSSAANNAQQSQPMNITGLPDSGTSSSEADDTSEDAAATETETVVETAPTKTTIEYSVASGSSVYLEIYEGDTATLVDTISGPATGSYDVTGELTIVSSPFDGLTITQDGEQVDLSEHVSGGVLNVTFSFADVLTKWTEEHTAATQSSATTSSTTSSTTATTTSN